MTAETAIPANKVPDGPSFCTMLRFLWCWTTRVKSSKTADASIDVDTQHVPTTTDDYRTFDKKLSLFYSGVSTCFSSTAPENVATCGEMCATRIRHALCRERLTVTRENETIKPCQHCGTL